jgi:DNA-binding GntR family transcriptional regulator
MAKIAKGKTSPAKRVADVVDRVYRQVREMAIDYRFRPGERLNEVELASRFKVSRTPIRQALNRLEQESFVTFVPNRGFYARDIAPDDLRRIYEFRALVECAAFPLACERGADDQIARIGATWREKTHECDDRDVMRDADEEFHLSIARLAGNHYIIHVLEDINAKLRFFRKIDLENPKRFEGTYREHAKILDHLRRRDPAGAEILRDHIAMSAEHAAEVTKEGLARIFFETSAAAE